MDLVTLKAAHAAGQLDKPTFIRRALALHASLFDTARALADTEVRAITLSPEGVCFEVGPARLRLWCPPDEARVAPIETLNFDRYEPREMAVLEALADGCRAMLDVGANIGWYAVWFATRVPAGRVWAFEPLPGPYAYLQRNVAANDVGDRVATFNLGLSRKNGVATFHFAPTNGTNASLLNVAEAPDAVPVIGVTMRLDDWVTAHGVVPDLVKCDVEGAELWVFEGAEGTLAKHRPAVLAELLRKWSRPFGYHPTDVLEFFRRLGYRALAIGGERPRLIEAVDDETVETNYVFLHPARHGDVLARLLGEG
ncbi:MAG: FkbM family methyltransferase [Candidatus Sericytochromatia bacterium]|nr:FkbM family methyltransferase [Candidatus Sericytochromatia bacterium]